VDSNTTIFFSNCEARAEAEMSTKTSADMHVGRSTTRRHAPPGGKSTFSVAWEENGSDKKPAAVEEIEEGKPTISPTYFYFELVEEIAEPEVVVEITSFKVGLAIVQGPGADVLLTVASKALGAVGIVNVVAGLVPFGSVLPYAAQRLLKSNDAVLALDIVSQDQIGSGLGSTSAVLSSALYQVGVSAEKPVIPGIVCQESLLEAKGVLPNLCEEWAGAILGMLNIASDKKFGKAAAPTVPPHTPPTPDITDDKVLLTKFRETLKVPSLFPALLSPLPPSPVPVSWSHWYLWLTKKVQDYGRRQLQVCLPARVHQGCQRAHLELDPRAGQARLRSL
jgi:6,7-dimethyl-8-ribityllumazine synthase